MATTIYPTVPVAQPEAEAWPLNDDPISIQADEMFARQLDTGFAGDVRNLLHDPETGLAAKGAEDALGGIAETLPMLGELKDRYLGQAIGPRQKAILEPLIDTRLDRATGDLGRLAQQATSELDDRSVAERIAGLQQDAAQAWHDPAHLRALGHATVNELRYQGERKGWDETQTDTNVRQGLSDLYAGAIEQAIGQDPDRATKLYDHAREVIEPERQASVERKIERVREERRVTEIVGGLAAAPDDPTRRPDFDDYRARAAELTLPDASPEVQAQVNRMVRIEHAQADRAWQAARGRAAVTAIDWLGKNPATPLLAMPLDLRDRLSPEQTERLDEAAINGGRVVTDRDVYEQLDRQAVHDPKTFAGLDLGQYRLSLDDQDYRRFVGFQKGLIDGRPDVAFQRYDLGRSVLDEGFEQANLALDGPEARVGRMALDKTLGAFEAIQGRPATLEDIDRIAGDIVQKAARQPRPISTEAAGNSNIDDVVGGGSTTNDDGVQVAQQQDGKVVQPAPPRGVTPGVEPVPGSPEFQAATTKAIGSVVRLPDGSTIPDEESPTGHLMSPDPDLGKVASAGRQAARDALSMGLSPTTAIGAAPYLYASLGIHLGHAGVFDYQRSGNMVTGYNQYRHFRNISNLNVGLFGQQAGFSLDQVLTITGKFAERRSSNARRSEPYGLDPKTREYVETGYKIGESGAYGKAVAHPYAPW